MPDMDSLDDPAEPDRGLRVALVLVLLATIVGGGIDLVLDAPDSWLSPHVIYEAAMIATASLTMVWLWRGWWRSQRDLTRTRHVLAERSAERDAWRLNAESHLAGLGKAIAEQMSSWRLTPVEREVALLLLKGHSHKQIAYATHRSERTVRQHAVAVYQKSGLNGRAEFAAFFLEGIPDQGTPDSR